MTLPVPRDMAELVVRVLRPLLAGRPEPVSAGVKVSTELGRGPDGGPVSVPWLLVAEDGHSWAWPAVQQATIRLTVWHRTPHNCKALAGLAFAVLCDSVLTGDQLAARPVAAPVAGIDPYTDAPLATAALAVTARTPLRP